MQAMQISASNLVKVDQEAHCWNCGIEAKEAPDQQAWSIWNDDVIYCPACAERKTALSK